jgi:hypothetical protein
MSRSGIFGLCMRVVLPVELAAGGWPAASLFVAGRS